jgi:hypothetical protein
MRILSVIVDIERRISFIRDQNGHERNITDMLSNTDDLLVHYIIGIKKYPIMYNKLMGYIPLVKFIDYINEDIEIIVDLKKKLNNNIFVFYIGFSYIHRLCYFQSKICVHNILDNEHVDIHYIESTKLSKIKIQINKMIEINISLNTYKNIFLNKTNENFIKNSLFNDKYLMKIIHNKNLNMEKIFNSILELDTILFMYIE